MVEANRDDELVTKRDLNKSLGRQTKIWDKKYNEHKRDIIKRFAEKGSNE